MRRLLQQLKELDGKPYGLLRRLSGRHADRDLVLEIDHVQGDPYAPASRMRLTLERAFHPLFGKIPDSPFHRLALEDLFLREFARRLPEESLIKGDGPGGRLKTCRPGPSILRRSAATFSASGLTLRFAYSFPAQSRRILGEPAAEVLANRLTGLAMDLFDAVTLERIETLAAHLARRAAQREAMADKGLVAFLPDGSVAARDEAGRPLKGAVPLQAPAELAVELALPDGSKTRGLAIPAGITVLAGSAFHGKTTLLEALAQASGELGITDGLAGACSTARTEFVRVEEDRAVATCDLSPFFRSLPGQDPSRFSADEASGATSQAANLHESLACGARLLLIDEDASAANFLTRDPRMASLLPKGESVVPLVARARELAARGVSLVVVAGASSEWLAVADRVVVLSEYQPSDASARAREVVREAGISVSAPAAADWKRAIGDETMERWKDLAGISGSKVKVQDGLVRLGPSAEARLPRRFGEDDALRAAAILLAEWLRHCRDRNLAPRRDGMIRFLEEKIASADPWGPHAGHDLAWPRAREAWAIWTRLRPARKVQGAQEEE